MVSDITELKYWLDLFIKAIIGIVVSVVGMDYRAVKNSLHELEETKYHLSMQVELIKAEMATVKDGLGRIDKKLDKALDK